LAPFLLAISDFLEPGGDSPKPTGDFELSPGFFIAMFGIGFLLAVVGHITRSRLLVGSGILLIFLATVLIPLFIGVTR
jgi:hypothetical protein